MKKLITVSKSNYLEIRNYENSKIPFDYYWDMTKKRGTIFLVNKHIDLEFLFITHGKLEIHLDNDTFFAENGDVVVVNSNILHNIIPVTDVVTYQCVIVDKNFFSSYDIPLDSIRFCEVIRGDSALFDEINAIKDILSNDVSDCCVAKVYIHLLKIMVTMYEKYSVPIQEGGTDTTGIHTVENSIKYINKYLGKQLSVDDIAEYAGYSKFYFCRRFKEITGYTVATYINMQRIKCAYNMLCESDMNINEVAQECGFKSGTYFSTTFKKYMGMNPSDVCKKHKE